MRLKPLLTKWLFLVGALAVPLGAFAENYTLEPAEADFGQVQVGGQLGEPATQTFTLTSTEDDFLVIYGIQIQDDSTESFEITSELPTFPHLMMQNETLDIEVTFTPELEADLDGSFIIVTNAIAGNDFKEVLMYGTGVDIVCPVAHDFGDVAVGETPTALITVTNTVTTGTTPLVVTGLSILPTSAFAIVGPETPIAILPGDSADITVAFAPTAIGPDEATLTIETDLVGDRSVALSGTGVTLVEPAIIVSPLQRCFGNVVVGTTETAYINIHNPGEAEWLEITEISLVGDQAFSIPILQTEATQPSLWLPPGDSGDLPIAFSPDSEGFKQAELVITSSAVQNPEEHVLLGGTGVPDDPPTSVSVADILAEFDASVADETLEGDGPGGSADGRLGALRNMIDACGDLIDAGEIEQACQQLQDAADRCDGQKPPPDFVSGDAAATLNALILTLLEQLGCG